MTGLIYIFLGGGLGSITRFLLSKIVNSKFENINPEATLLSNLLATLILAIITLVLFTKFQNSDFIKYFLIIGFCGGFSTFSTFSFELFFLFKNGFHIYGILYALISVVFCIGLIFLISKFI